MTSKHELEEALFEWTAGSRLETLRLIDALHFIKYGKHNPEIKEDYPEELASKSFIKLVRDKIKQTRRELREKYPSGIVHLYRGGREGESWTTDRKTAEFFAKGSRIKERDVPIDRVLFYLEPYTRESGEEEYIIEEEG